jgi:hypothetical protein
LLVVGGHDNHKAKALSEDFFWLTAEKGIKWGVNTKLTSLKSEKDLF